MSHCVRHAHGWSGSSGHCREHCGSTLPCGKPLALVPPKTHLLAKIPGGSVGLCKEETWLMTPPLRIGDADGVDKCVLLADRLMGLLGARMRPTAEEPREGAVLEITLISAPPGKRELLDDSVVVM